MYKEVVFKISKGLVEYFSSYDYHRLEKKSFEKTRFKVFQIHKRICKKMFLKFHISVNIAQIDFKFSQNILEMICNQISQKKFFRFLGHTPPPLKLKMTLF